MNEQIHFCDTDVWIKLGSINQIELLYINCNMIYITEVVKEEILHIGKKFKEFRNARIELLKRLKEKDRIKVIYPHIEFENLLDRQAIVVAAHSFNYQYGLDCSSKNFGEITTAIIADMLDIKVIKSDDGDFKEKIEESFYGIQIQNLYDIFNIAISNNVVDHKIRIRLQRDIEDISKEVRNKKKKSEYFKYDNNLVDMFLGKLL